jgi:hypothetical protein
METTGGDTADTATEEAAVQPLASVMVTLYVPVEVASAANPAGSSVFAVYPFGPLQAKVVYGVVPPEGVDIRLILAPRQTGLFAPAVTSALGRTVTDRLDVAVQPTLSVTVMV